MKSKKDKDEKFIKKELDDIKTNSKNKKKDEDIIRQEIFKRRFIIGFAIVAGIILLIFFCNRTFFKHNYKTSKIDLDIPRLMFFIKDDGNQIVFKTYRKSEYVRNFFDNQLNNYPYYQCPGGNFFYDEINQTAIYSIDVEKGFAMKTVTVNYAKGDHDCLCLSGLKGKAAEEACNIKK